MSEKITKPTIEQAEDAVRTLLRFAGDDPDREGLRDTPKRVVKSYEEFFSGYATDPNTILSRTFKEVDGYDEMVVLRDINFSSHCEHHVVPFTGKVHIAYLPNNKVVGISKLARLVDIYAKRLQIQEKFTSQIANSLKGRCSCGGGDPYVYDYARSAEKWNNHANQQITGAFPQ